MPRMCRLVALTVTLYVGLGVWPVISWAQGFGPETYGLVGDMAMGTPATSRVLGMGGELSCLTDRQFSNPAFAGVEAPPAVGLRLNSTDLERGPSLTSLMAGYYHPLRSGKDGLQLTLLTLSGEGGGLMLPGVGPVNTDLMSNAWVVDYGCRVGAKVLVGLSILGHERAGLSLKSVAGPTLFSLDATANYGARVGAAYEWRPGDYVGLLWNASQESVTTSGPLATVSGTTHVNSNQVSLGVSHHFAPQWLAAVEYQRGRISTGSTVGTSDEWHLGAEYQSPQGWALRIGLSDDSPTFGAGYRNDRWSADYTFISDWKSDALDPLFGGSDTHSVQVIYGW